VCTLYTSDHSPICVCPKRLFQAALAEDVVANAWAGPRPEHPTVAYEVTMEKFGKVDMVIADVRPGTHKVQQFVSVELQAVDITGSYLPAYVALTNSRTLERRPTFNFNWANVQKRFVSQLIAKGYYHHQWGTRIVAVVQTELFRRMQKHARVPGVQLEESNIVFMLYDYQLSDGRLVLRLDEVVPTTHTNVMNAILYERPPSREQFEGRIIGRLS